MSKKKKSSPSNSSSPKEPMPLPSEIRERLWDHLQSVGHRPIGISELSRELALNISQQRLLRAFLKQQVEANNMTPFRGGRFMLQEKLLGQPCPWRPQKSADPPQTQDPSSSGRSKRKSSSTPEQTFRGILHKNPNGYGFVQREGEDALFVPPQFMHGAIHGDEVVVVKQQDPTRGESARIIQISRPFSGLLVGRVYAQNRQLLFSPDNDKYGTLPAVWQGKKEEGEPGQWAVGEVCRSDWDPEHIWVEIIRWLPAQDGTALDRARSTVLLQADTFPPEVLTEANAVAVQPTPETWGNRLDLRPHRIFTIDGDDARDFDDAICLTSSPDGLRRIIVAIADVTHYVREGTPLDQEALRRATSVYFPASCLPMLPEPLSNNICSLRPREDRLVMAAFLDYNEHAECIHVELHEAVICSQARLTYTQVAQLLDQPDNIDDQNPAKPLRDDLLVLHTFTQQLRAKRMERGSIDLDLPEPKVIFDDQENIVDIRRSERHPSHQLIEELMLQANEAVAQFFLKHDIPGVYRIHEEPATQKIENYLELVERLGLASHLQLEHDAPHAHSHLWELDPKFFGRVLRQIEGHDAQHLLHQSLLRSMKQAFYSAENTGHYGLAMEHYLHFTSPIRRYPDLAVHRMLKRYLHHQLPTTEQGLQALHQQMQDIAEQSSVRERMAMQAEREVLGRYRARFLQNHIGEEFEGTITAIAPFGIFVELDAYFVEGLIHIRNLPGDYRYDEQMMAMIGPRSGDTFRLGERLIIRVDHASPLRGEIDFSLVRKHVTTLVEKQNQ